jgi:hypothetical protein
LGERKRSQTVKKLREINILPELKLYFLYPYK